MVFAGLSFETRYRRVYCRSLYVHRVVHISAQHDSKTGTRKDPEFNHLPLTRRTAAVETPHHTRTNALKNRCVKKEDQEGGDGLSDTLQVDDFELKDSQRNSLYFFNAAVRVLRAGARAERHACRGSLWRRRELCHTEFRI